MIIIIINFFGIIHYLKILEIVFRTKKLIKANYKPNRMKVSNDTFQQSFHKCSVKKHIHTNANISASTHRRT